MGHNGNNKLQMTVKPVDALGLKGNNSQIPILKHMINYSALTNHHLELPTDIRYNYCFIF